MGRIKILKIIFVFALFVFFVLASNFETIEGFFMATVQFNVIITTVFLVGFTIIMQASIKLTMLGGTFGSIAYKKGTNLEFYLKGINDVMPAHLAHMLDRRARNNVLYFTEDEAKSIIEWMEINFFNTKGYVGFFVHTSLMVGLFGTFTGLLESIDKMAEIILSFGGENIDLGQVMMEFSGPLSGMAIGFSASLFGVSSAIMLSTLLYLLNRNQDTFIEDMETWLKDKIIDTQPEEVLERLVAHNVIKPHVLAEISPTYESSNNTNEDVLSLVSKISSYIENQEALSLRNTKAFEELMKHLSSSNKDILLNKEISNEMFDYMKSSNKSNEAHTKMIEESINSLSKIVHSSKG